LHKQFEIDRAHWANYLSEYFSRITTAGDLRQAGT
jgi:hypothetical protein